MPRCDENGRQLQAVLGYKLDRAIPATELHKALGIARNTYANRSQEDTFPDAEECRLFAEYFDLNPAGLMLDFGLLHWDHIDGLEAAGYISPGKGRGGSATATTKQRGRERTTLETLPRRTGVPPM